jgi:hypothetical protein
VRINVPFPGRNVVARAWKVRVGRVSRYLLDTNDPENGPADRGITSQLYGGAQGTGRMKVLVNGGLNLSELDGWWVEAYAPDLGWSVSGSGDSSLVDAANALWQRSVREKFPQIRFEQPVIEARGGSYRYEVRCHLGDLDPEGVAIELYADGRGGASSERHPMHLRASGDDGSRLFGILLKTDRPIGDYTVRAIAHHRDAMIPLEANEIAWQR